MIFQQRACQHTSKPPVPLSSTEAESKAVCFGLCEALFNACLPFTKTMLKIAEGKRTNLGNKLPFSDLALGNQPQRGLQPQGL